ncbi:hypothetical protein EQ500_04510 [Lactobacillus sp. XV13L]|nr:hypothetical protein [Lactobacillus sp. XV13L]
MHYQFNLLLLSGLLIVIASFSLVFSFDYKKARTTRRLLLLTGIILFIVIGFLVALQMRWPLV